MKAFDWHTGGLHKGQLIILAARRSIGKTALLLTWFDHMMRGGKACLLFSLEMRKQEVNNRIISMRSGLSYGALMSGHFGDQAWNDIARVNAELQPAPFWIDDTAAVSLAQIHAKARQGKAQNDIAVLGVDYIQIMSTGREGSRAEKVAALSGGLKKLARELDIPVIALSQFRKAKQGEEHKYPDMDDLKESGALGDDADVVVLLHRKRTGEEGYENKTRFDLAKQRNGPTGVRSDTFPVTFLPKRMRFVDGAEEPDEEQVPLG